MNEIDNSVSTQLQIKLNEAETCYTMGLYADALKVYEAILNDYKKIDFHTKVTINDKIDTIKRELSEEEQVEPKTVSENELSLFKQNLTSQENVPTIVDSALAFKDLGLYEEAIAEYAKLFNLEYSNKRIVSEISDCLLSSQTPINFVPRVETLLEGLRLEKSIQTQIYFFFGMEMEQRDHKDLAVALYKGGLKVDPNDAQNKKRLKTVEATLTGGSRYDYLLRHKMVTTDQLQKAVALSKKMKKSVEFILVEHFQIKKEDIGKSFSAFYGCPMKFYDPLLATPFELLGDLKKSFLLNELWVPITWGKDGVEILVDDPRDLNKTDHIRALMKTQKIVFSVAIKEDIEEYIKRFFETEGIIPQKSQDTEIDDFDLIPDISFEEEDEEDYEEEEIADGRSNKVVKLVDQVIIAAFRKNASDIHIEPSPISKATNIRFRMDGICHDYIKVPNSMVRGIISRLKIMAHLDIAERRLPQDGKIKFRRKGVQPFEIRLATLPTASGYEDAVLRILSRAAIYRLDQMELTDRNLNVMKDIINRPYGLILCVGPTGSGKTTSLHAALEYINKPGIKIWTAEDPIEITQGGLRQVEVKRKIGLDFARIMRAFLRADPDVIMIGEMRDEETASIGIEASLTGHLVFSTLHTNTAPETITRLLDMGLNPLNFADAFLGVLGQRLVRRLCTDCREAYHPEASEFTELVNEYAPEMFEKTGIEYNDDLTLYRPVGCDKCTGTGYRGRLAIHEMMPGSPDIKTMIKRNATTEEFFAKAQKEGMTTLKQDGILKVLRGITDMREVWRVCIN